MADLHDFIGIKSPNPFWLASAPPTDKEYNVVRAFKAGWGGVVWKTLGERTRPSSTSTGPALRRDLGPDRNLLGLNNIELITDRRSRSTCARSSRSSATGPTGRSSCR
jgi:dihydropyrimidine dehydrogenase (NAD+) subunit PreA